MDNGLNELGKHLLWSRYLLVGADKTHAKMYMQSKFDQYVGVLRLHLCLKQVVKVSVLNLYKDLSLQYKGLDSL